MATKKTKKEVAEPQVDATAKQQEKDPKETIQK